MKLAKLEKVELREVWKHEASDFTTWLVKPENLQLLGDALDLRLEPLEREAKVDKFWADIVAKEVSSDRVVVIENQLGESDHDHLGKCITYAAGKEADIIIWIVKRATEAHRKAVEWMNERTDDEIAFFLVEIEALRIGQSDVAPNFKIIEQPNEWARAFKRGTDGISETNLLYLKFWTSFSAYANTRSDFMKRFNPTRPMPQNWMAFSSFATGCHLSLVCNTFPKRVLAKIYISQHSPYIDVFKDRYSEIQDALGVEFECGKAKDQTYSIVNDFDISGDEKKWPECFKWFCDTFLKLLPEVQKLIKN